MVLKVICFDFDGVLGDTANFSYRSHMCAATDLGLPQIEKERFYRQWGIDWDEFLTDLWPGVDVIHFQEICRGYDRSLSPIVAFPGAQEALLLLSRHFHLAMVTTRDRKSFWRCRQDQVVDFSIFRFIQVREDCSVIKPDPDVFRRLLHLMRVVPNEVCYIGDTLDDYRAARDAGMYFLAVATGPRDQAEHFQAEGLPAQCICKAVADVPNLLLNNGDPLVLLNQQKQK